MSNANSTSHRPPMRRPLWLAVAAITAALVAAASATAQAGTADPVDVAVSSYASDYAVTHEEAQRRLDRIQPLQDILTSIRSLETSRVAGWGIDHAGTFTGWVWLTGDAEPSTSATKIVDAHTDVEIRTGATHTRVELLAAQQGLFQDIGPTGQVTDGPESLTQIKLIVTYTNIDMRANAVEIAIDPGLASTVPGGLTDPGPVAVTDEALQAKITEVSQILQDHIDVNFNIVDGRGIALEASFGAGQDVRLEKGTKAWNCTSGFAAQRNSTGEYGIITAGHCGDKGATESWTVSMHNIDLPFEYGWASFSADAQFHTIPTGSGHVLNDDYLCHDSWPINYCDVTGDISRSQMINDWVCHTGRSSGITCGRVVSIDLRPGWGSCHSSSGSAIRCDNVFVGVTSQSLRSCRGDSGGPWYRTGVAYGIHMSSNSKNDCNKSDIHAFFSGIREVENFLWVQILTEGSVTVN